MEIKENSLGCNKNKVMLDYINLYEGSMMIKAGSDITKGTLKAVLFAAIDQPDWVVRSREDLYRISREGRASFFSPFI
jgi:hypothetical protein